jgi:TRAP transporter 4TM/12TM fusion protein
MRELEGKWKILVGILAGVWSIILVYTALTVGLHPILQGAISLSLGLAIVFLAYPHSSRITRAKEAEKPGIWDILIFGTVRAPSLWDIILVVAAVFPCIYLMTSWEVIVRSAGYYETYQLVFGAMLIFCLLEGTRRSLGNSIPILVLGFILYALYGEHIPGLFGHAGFGGEEVLYQLYLMQEGIWGLLTDMTSSLIALFVLFGPVLFATGVGKTFMDIALLSGGRVRGGAGHVAVIGSSFFGMLSGSSVANVATTGSFTIPTMKKLKFPPELAAGVEASASSGGQIMPPIMGAGCFIMAEFLNVSYITVMIAGIMPGVIYFIGVSAGIWVEAGRYGIGKIPKELMPNMREASGIQADGDLSGARRPADGDAVYVLSRPKCVRPGHCLVAMVNYLLIGGPLNAKAIWIRVKHIWVEGYLRAVLTALAWLMVMMSCVQMAVTIISMTGFGVKVSAAILTLAGTNLFLALIATMLIAIVLGMGMTTTAAYVIAAAVLVPALDQLGLPSLASHLFIFYFAIKSGLTPPVCIAVYTAAAIANSNWLSSAWASMRLGIGGYIMPFYFILMPEYLMQGNVVTIIYVFISAIAAMFAIEAGIMGYFTKPLTMLERALYTLAGFLVLAPLTYNIIGVCVWILGYLLERFDVRIPIISVRPKQIEMHHSKPATL